MSRISRIFEKPTEYWWQDFKYNRDSFGDGMIQITALYLAPKRASRPCLSLQISLNDQHSHSKTTHSISRCYKSLRCPQNIPLSIFSSLPHLTWRALTALCVRIMAWNNSLWYYMITENIQSFILWPLGLHFIHLLVCQETREKTRGGQERKGERKEGNCRRGKGRKL